MPSLRSINISVLRNISETPESVVHVFWIIRIVVACDGTKVIRFCIFHQPASLVTLD